MKEVLGAAPSCCLALLTALYVWVCGCVWVCVCLCQQCVFVSAVCVCVPAVGEGLVQPEALNKKAIQIINRVRDKLTGTFCTFPNSK